MQHRGDRLAYLIFPLVGILLAMQVPADRLPLRLLVVVVISGLGVIAADAGFSPRHLLNLRQNIRSTSAELRQTSAETGSRFMLLALVLMILSASSFSPDNNRDHIFTTPVVLMIAGAMCLWMSLRFAAPAVEVATLTDTPMLPERSRLSLTLIGVVMLLASGEIGGRILLLDLPRVSLTGQAILFYGGIFLLIIGLGGVQRISLPKLPTFRLERPRRRWLNYLRREIVIIALLFIGAFVVRAWNLETGLRASIDEAIAIDGINHYYGGAIGLVARPSQYIPTLLFSQWQGLLMNIFGRSVTTLRLVSAIIGALTVVATYLLARDLFKDKLTGLIAGLFMMTFPPHIHFSRIGLLHIGDVLFGTLSIWFLVRGLQSNRRLDWVLAGVSLGMTQYFFEAGRLFYVPLVAAWLGLTILWMAIRRLRRDKQITPLPLKGILIATVALVMVAMPTYYAAFSRGSDANPRLTTSGGFNLFTSPLQDGLTQDEATVMARRILFPFTVYVHQPEVAVFYGGDQPLMLVYVVPFFLMGTVYLLWRWRSAAFLIALWILATALINALLRDSAVYARWHVVFPGVAVVVAVALRYLLPVIWSGVTTAITADTALVTILRRAAVPLALIAFMVVGQAVYYYGWHVPLLEKQARLFKPYPDVYDMAIRSFDFPDFTDIYQMSEPIADINVPRTWIGFMTKSDPSTLTYTPVASADVTPDYVAALSTSHNLAFFVDPNSTDVIYLLELRFGCTMQESPYPIDPPEKGFLLCYVPSAPAVG